MRTLKKPDWVAVRAFLADLPTGLFGGLIVATFFYAVIAAILPALFPARPGPESAWLSATLWLAGTALTFIPRKKMGREAWRQWLSMRPEDPEEESEKRGRKSSRGGRQ